MTRVDHSAMMRRVRLAEVWLAVIVVFGAALVGRIIVAGPLFGHEITVKVMIPEAAGLHARSDVSYRGQHIGTVTAVDLTATGVQATLKLQGDVDVPRNSEIVVANLSAVGEQYVDIRPRTAAGPFLADGSEVNLDKTALPVPTWQVLAHTQRLLRRVDTADLRTIAREVRAIFGSGEVDLPGLVDELDRTLDMVERLSPDVLGLVREGEKPLKTLHDLSPAVRSLLANSRAITAQLAKSNATIARLIDQGATLVPIVLSDFKSTSPVLVKLLDDGTPVAAMARAHLPGLAHWFAWGPDQLVAMADGTRDGSARVIFVLTAADNCHYGPIVSPYQRKVTMPMTARCTTVDPHIQQRGSQNVPRP
jgi:phospholipid/cholesterol/gamma-HCH transport system substrate-binding protein